MTWASSRRRIRTPCHPHKLFFSLLSSHKSYVPYPPIFEPAFACLQFNDDLQYFAAPSCAAFFNALLAPSFCTIITFTEDGSDIIQVQPKLSCLLCRTFGYGSYLYISVSRH